ncbi:MAG: 30S ribosomal protein S4 [Candidatus Sungbacteria bacterium]|nr:30S ribosomal protein S4 [Candidatus Sungbacteria bacterium]
MARKILEKTERRLGERLFLKGTRCVGPKCAVVRRNYPPGIQGTKRRRKDSSEYGSLSREKQKVRYFYGIDNKDIKRYTEAALKRRGVFSFHVLQLLEQRLDNVVFRLGFAESRRQARQMVTHGLVMIGGTPVRTPSYQVAKGEEIALKEGAAKSPLVAAAEQRIKKYEPPKWLEVDKTKHIGSVLRVPEEGDVEIIFDTSKIKEFYSR